MKATAKYNLVWGGDCDGIYRANSDVLVVSANEFSNQGWHNLIGASQELIDKIGRERDKEQA